MGFNCLKATEPLRGDSLLFTTAGSFPSNHFLKKTAIFQISYGFPALKIYQNLTNFYSHKTITKNKVFPVHCNFNFYK